MTQTKMDRQNKRRLEDAGSMERGRHGKRKMEANSCCGNGPERPVESQEEQDISNIPQLQ